MGVRARDARKLAAVESSVMHLMLDVVLGSTFVVRAGFLIDNKEHDSDVWRR